MKQVFGTIFHYQSTKLYFKVNLILKIWWRSLKLRLTWGISKGSKGSKVLKGGGRVPWRVALFKLSLLREGRMIVGRLAPAGGPCGGTLGWAAAAAAAVASSKSGSPSKLSTLRPGGKEHASVQIDFPTQKKSTSWCQDNEAASNELICPSMAGTVQTATSHTQLRPFRSASIREKALLAGFPFCWRSTSSNSFDLEASLS